MIKGSCLCGTVQFAVNGGLSPMSHCHCSMCRKAHGAAFATYTSAPEDSFEWLSGEHAVRHYESSPVLPRTFCGECGSVLPGPVVNGEIFIPAGLFDDEPGVRPAMHIFASSAPAWQPPTGDLPRYDDYGPNSDFKPVERPPLPPATPGVVRGSCLCGDVAFEVIEPFKVVHNCHCSRCRKARAAAHTTNGFTSVDGVRVTRGAELIATFKVPDARFFTHAFCRRCGSGLPRLDVERGIANIPLGALDDEPGARAVDHIYVGSKASWFAIADDLPQFQERPE